MLRRVTNCQILYGRVLKGTKDMNWMLLGVLVAKVLHGHQNLRISAQQMAEDVLVSGLVNLA